MCECLKEMILNSRWWMTARRVLRRFHTFESNLIFFLITFFVHRPFHPEQKSIIFIGVISHIKQLYLIVASHYL